jgi:phytanoyl-CoA hydroxylase
MLTTEQCQFYEEQGYLHIPQVFPAEDIDQMEQHMNALLEDWAQTDMGWTGPWRKAYMDAETSEKSKLTHLHDLHFYSEAWSRAMLSSRLTGAMADLLGPNVELHHTTLHMKPPQTGHPFPLHQDNAFYEHTDGRYIDVLVHLDDTRHENGEIRFLAGSHKAGYLPHITQTPDGECTPHLSTDEYRLEDTVAVPAKRGDVVLFNIFTVHGSYINQTDRVRRLVRCGFRAPENDQLSGQSMGRPGVMVRGIRPHKDGQLPFSEAAIA